MHGNIEMAGIGPFGDADQPSIRIHEIWIAAYVDPVRIKKTLADIEALDFGTFAPTYVETIFSARSAPRRVERPILGPYILIAVQSYQMHSWSVLNGVEGVLRVLAVDGRPLEVKDAQKARLMWSHINREYDFITYRSGWKPIGKNGQPKKISTKPKRSAQAVRHAKKAKAAVKKLRKLRNQLNRALAESRKW